MSTLLTPSSSVSGIHRLDPGSGSTQVKVSGSGVTSPISCESPPSVQSVSQ